VLSFFSSCKKTTAQQTHSDGSAETLEPNTSYKPAFKGQTRIKAVKTNTPYQVEVLTKGLGRPWGIINLPDGRFLITEKQAI
jgi:glucose/arabinose dehydrogenase